MEINDPTLGIQEVWTGVSRPVAQLDGDRPWPKEHIQALLRLSPHIVELGDCCESRGRYIWPGVPTFSVAFALDEHLAVRDVEFEANGQDIDASELDCVRQGFAAALRDLEAIHRRQATIVGRLEEVGVLGIAETVGRLQTILSLQPDEAGAAEVVEKASLTLDDLIR